MRRRDLAATVAGFVAGGAVLAVLAHLVGAGAVLDALARARTDVAALVAVAILLWLALWGGSLRVVLAAVGSPLSRTDAVLVHAAAAFANNVTPFGQAGGEPVAAWLLADVSDAPYERSLAAMTSFDVVNLVPSLALAVVGLGYYSAVTVLDNRLRAVAVGLTVAVVGLPALGALGWRYRRRLELMAVRVATPAVRLGARVLPRTGTPGRDDVADRIGGFVAGIEAVAGDRRRLAPALGYATAGWIVQATGLWLALTAVGATVPPYVPLFVVPLSAFASAMPTPGGLGGIETVQVALLTATTGQVAATLTAAVLLFSVGGFFLTTTVGAGAVAVITLRARVAAPG